MSITIKDAQGDGIAVKSTFDVGAQAEVPHHIIDSMPTIQAEVTGALTDTELRAAPVIVGVGDGTDTAEIMTGPVAGEKGVRVFIGPTDPVSDLPVFVDFEHHQVHEGETFKAQSLALSATTMFRFSVPAGYSPTIRAPHLVLSAEVYSGALKLELFEGFSGTPTPGTALVIRNRNRNVAIPDPATVAIHPVTGTLTGTSLLETHMISAGNGEAKSRQGSEWILKPNTDYLIVATEVSAFTNTFVNFDWYEDTGV